MSEFVRIDQKRRQVVIRDFKTDHPIIFNYFSNQPDSERDALLSRALAIGVLALLEDRLSAFLAKTSSLLGTELESLKYIYDLNQQIFLRTTGKGRDAESELLAVLTEYCRGRDFGDALELVGDQFGALKKNKSGDLVAVVRGGQGRRIVIESKFDKAKRLGLISEKDVFAKSDTALGQLLESAVNREAVVAIIVFDRSLVDPKLLDEVGSIRYLPLCGFVCIIDTAKGDYSNLFLCYEIARSLALVDRAVESESLATLNLLVGRFLHDFSLFEQIKRQVKASIKGQLDLLKLVEQALLSIEFSKEAFAKFAESGRLTREELHELYQAEDVRERYQAIARALEQERQER